MANCSAASGIVCIEAKPARLCASLSPARKGSRQDRARIARPVPWLAASEQGRGFRVPRDTCVRGERQWLMKNPSHLT